jgi:hypothetical protein
LYDEGKRFSDIICPKCSKNIPVEMIQKLITSKQFEEFDFRDAVYFGNVINS